VRARKHRLRAEQSAKLMRRAGIELGVCSPSRALQFEKHLLDRQDRRFPGTGTKAVAPSPRRKAHPFLLYGVADEDRSTDGA
jgi:hypothetical protein